MTKKQIVRALIRIARQSWRAAPFGIIRKLAGAIIDAVLPLVIAYFAAQTTTALAVAYAGDWKNLPFWNIGGMATRRLLVYTIKPKNLPFIFHESLTI